MEIIDFSKKNKLEKKIDDLEKQLSDLKTIVNDMQKTLEKKLPEKEMEESFPDDKFSFF